MAKKVLIIDDDKNTVRFLSVALQENGYEAHGAYDGVEGLEAARRHNPDLIILDVMMPKRTGFVMFKQLRKDEDLRTIPVIMVTGVADSLNELESHKGDTHESPYEGLRESLRKAILELREEGLVKPELFVDKPIDPEQVIAKVKDLIG